MPSLCIKSIPALALSHSASITVLLSLESRILSSKKHAVQRSSFAVRTVSQNPGTQANLEDFSSKQFYRESSPRETRVTQRACWPRSQRWFFHLLSAPSVPFCLATAPLSEKKPNFKTETQGSTLNSIKKAWGYLIRRHYMNCDKEIFIWIWAITTPGTYNRLSFIASQPSSGEDALQYI